ncbi:GH3 auxin-responsive promoter family protein [Flagellimonas allohymeniacidonis]|uniref:GH3 auxin-responsive promoter family protein n=1 Tax=Flagellimonas allohymeniacidonis TaxID=2517819 RepID=A0A4Q8QGP0_9FLAO|nr:GH3 auxin-responsive promoter family protein [Allomuricauda hymeniacidonis]TAI47549.1 GH3 auxin-responsive promoter family protein [Allomuricauda hymeniacidonis]
MSLKAFAARLFAHKVARKNNKWIKNPIETQRKVFEELIRKAGETQFGKDHRFNQIKNHSDFVERVPVRDYEQLKNYVDQIINGQNDVLWPGKPIYFAKTSGTTSGAKYIPITKDSIKYHINASRDAILSYIHETGNTNFVDGRMIFLQGSPLLEEKNGIKLGRLSGISAHYVPNYLQKNRLPSWETNCIEDWETKVEKIIEETQNEDMTVIAGIPSWVQMYFERLHAKTGKKIGDLFKNFQLFIYGGVNYQPYKAKFENLIGRKVDSIELFPASEGFFAYQDSQNEPGMLLLLNSGMFYEFIKADEFFEENPRRLTLAEVELQMDYALIISTNAGLWAYNIGDTVRFVSLNPYRIVVSGRIKHFISAFGEHVIAKEVEEALNQAVSESDALVNEFSVAPQTSPSEEELPYHEWFIEFERPPENISKFAETIDKSMQKQNSYYFDLIEGKILQPLKICQVRPGGFQDYMKSIGKLGGQNKVQRLANDRKVAEGLSPFKK